MDFVSAEKETRKAVTDMHIPEADYFMDNFLPAYEATLDESTN